MLLEADLGAWDREKLAAGADVRQAVGSSHGKEDRFWLEKYLRDTRKRVRED